LYGIPQYKKRYSVKAERRKEKPFKIEKELKKKIIIMTILEGARKSIPSTDGVKDLQKFFDLGDKYSARIPNQNIVDFQLLILAKLEGKAYELCRNLEEITWENVKRALENAFSEKKSISLLNIELANCFQKEDESIAEFGTRIKTIIRKLSKAYKEQDANIVFYDTDAPALSAFEDGLIDPNMRILVKSNCVSLDDALKLATIEENRKKNKLEKSLISQLNSTTICTFCSGTNHNLHNCIKFKKDNNICKRCDQVGHFPSECPKKNNNNFQNRPHYDNNYRNNYNSPQNVNNNYRNNYNNPQNMNNNYRNNYNTPQNNNSGNFSQNQNRFPNDRNSYQNNNDRSINNNNNRFDQNRYSNRSTGNTYYNNNNNNHRSNQQNQSNGMHNERITVINQGNGNPLEIPAPSRN
jgi:hypothetical protein